MPPTPFAPWHDFYALLGSAAATLVGLMFVAASVGTSVFNSERQVGLRTFLSPTVVAFSVVLGVSLVAMLPASGGRVAGALLLALGLLGCAYAVRVGQHMRTGGMLGKIDLEDRLWYLAGPGVAYAMVAGAAVLLLRQADLWGCAVLAGGVVLLLLAGIRNAWDMTTWVILRSNG